MKEEARNQILYGMPEKLPNSRIVRAGPLSADFIDGTLRYIRINGQEIVRSIYVAVRDKNWGTVPPRFTRMNIEQSEASFCIQFTAEHVNEEVGFIWEGSVEGTADGTIRFAMNGKTTRTFLRNRIGFCILHPITLAGIPVTIDCADGTISSRFPELVSPEDPFLNIVSMKHEVEDGMQLELLFEGELFETEDQRNWTDASYKTFCTPLSRPYPVEIGANEVVTQSVTLRLQGSAAAKATGEEGIRLLLRPADGSRTLPKLGLGFSPASVKRGEKEQHLLTELHLHHYHLSLKLASPDWKELFRSASRAAAETSAGLILEVITDADGLGLDEFVRETAAIGGRINGIAVYEEFAFITTASLNRLLADKLRAAGLDIRIAGGTRANFAEFNRMEMPLAAMDYANYTINPQTHAFDIASIIETLDAQPATVHTARDIVREMPLHVGPISFKPRVNPVAATAEEARKAENPAAQRDARLHSLFGAGWTLGCIRRMAEAGAEEVTFYEHAGDLGVIAADGVETYPVYELFRYLADYREAEMLPLDISHPLQFDALALRTGTGISLLLANFTDNNLELNVAGFVLNAGRIHRYHEAEHALVWEAASMDRSGEAEMSIILPPFAFACLEATEEAKEHAQMERTRILGSTRGEGTVNNV